MTKQIDQRSVAGDGNRSESLLDSDMFQFARWRSLQNHAYPRTRAAGVFVLAIPMIVIAHSVRAEVRIEGDARAVRIEASQASVADVLTALGPSLNVRFRTAMPLHGVINGTFTGPLEQVIPKLLGGYNYVLKKERNSIELLILGTRGTRAVFIEPAKAPAQESLAKQWRTPIDTAKAKNP